MAQPAKKKATYDDLLSLPENVVGELIDGELFATPRPTYAHAVSTSVIGGLLLPPFQIGGGGGPGGWWILYEPEIHLGENVLVPDLAGWKKERMPSIPEGHWTSLPPDWVCEVLSPGTVRLDKMRKLPIYAEFGVAHLWLVDPRYKTLETFRLQEGRWLLLACVSEADKVRAEPFHEIEFDLRNLWGD